MANHIVMEQGRLAQERERSQILDLRQRIINNQKQIQFLKECVTEWERELVKLEQRRAEQSQTRLF